eukprot:4133035-Prymnesium_polylepis.1
MSVLSCSWSTCNASVRHSCNRSDRVRHTKCAHKTSLECKTHCAPSAPASKNIDNVFHLVTISLSVPLRRIAARASPARPRPHSAASAAAVLRSIRRQQRRSAPGERVVAHVVAAVLRDVIAAVEATVGHELRVRADLVRVRLAERAELRAVAVLRLSLIHISEPTRRS